MPEQLSRFVVIGLHASRTMDVLLKDNKLVLVGENGTGKSTFANLIYFFLTKQWSRLHEVRFSRIHAYFGDQELVLTPEHLQEHFAAQQQLLGFSRVGRHATGRMQTFLVDQLMGYALRDWSDLDPETLERLADELHMPPRAFRDLLTHYRKELKGKPTHLQVLERRIAELVQGQFLYLPTYRRIEQDLRSIFRGVEIEAELRKFRERSVRRTEAPYLELVEFGMEDVERMIASRMGQIKDNVRKGLDNLTGTYLREVIRGVHTQVEVQGISDVDAKSLDSVFARIDETTLPASDKQLLREKVARMSTSGAIDEQDKVIAHFLSKLIEFYAEQQANDKNVRDFVTLCNGYLTGKELIYDNAKYTIHISQFGESERSGNVLEMKSLSSGEKQIVSLFSHLYLSGNDRFFVVIDEPELSLSVPWQRRFLPDIIGTGMCTGLVSVTHSPFVWENEFEPYVRSLASFTTAYSGATS